MKAENSNNEYFRSKEDIHIVKYFLTLLQKMMHSEISVKNHTHFRMKENVNTNEYFSAVLAPIFSPITINSHHPFFKLSIEQIQSPRSYAVRVRITQQVREFKKVMQKKTREIKWIILHYNAKFSFRFTSFFCKAVRIRPESRSPQGALGGLK